MNLSYITERASAGTVGRVLVSCLREKCDALATAIAALILSSTSAAKPESIERGQERFSASLWLSIGGALWLLATLTRFWLAPMIEQLPRRYLDETYYAAKAQFRSSPSAKWEKFDLVVRRRDESLTSSGNVSLIQGDIHWITPAGVVSYETMGLYGVDRTTRANVSGYGNAERSGQYLFPPHIGQKSFQFWDPFYSGPRTATFDRVDSIDGLTVYVFNYVADHIDDTMAYLALPEVPERYRCVSDGAGKLCIEPVSGIVVDFQDGGVSYFVNATSGEKVADLYYWTAVYTMETKQAQLRRARSERLRLLALKRWLPSALVFGGMASCFLAGSRWRAAAIKEE